MQKKQSPIRKINHAKTSGGEMSASNPGRFLPLAKQLNYIDTKS